MDAIQFVRKIASDYADQNLDAMLVQPVTEGERKHIIDIAASVLMTRDGIGYPGGGFVQAIVDNDLLGAVSRADSTCYQAIKFFVMLKHWTANVKYQFENQQ